MIKRSNVYLIICLQQIDKNLYKTKTLRELLNVLQRVNRLRKNLRSDLEYRRVYIPKASSGSFAESDRHTFRPLGVPSLPWRIYLNMLEHPLTLSAPLNRSQHGFTPNRGTLTAWSEIFRKVVDSPDIYEIDLKQCFPSINLYRVDHILKTRYKFPKEIRSVYINVNKQTPEIKGQIHCNEVQSQLIDIVARNKGQWKTNMTTAGFKYNPSSGTIFMGKGRVIPGINLKSFMGKELSDIKYITNLLKKKDSLAKFGIKSDILTSFLTSLNGLGFSNPKLQEKILADVGTHLLHNVSAGFVMPELQFLKMIGTVQGSPLSPYLSAISIQEIADNLPANVKVLQYADDMIFYGEGLATFIGENGTNLAQYLAQLGFTMHMEKSGWIKRENKILKPVFKFLGAEYDQEKHIFRSQTRKGTMLNFTKGDLLSAEYDINEMIIGTDKNTGKALDSTALETRIFEKVLMYRKRLKVERGKQASGAYHRVNLLRDLVIHYSNQLAYFVMFRMSRIHYEVFYLILRVMSQPYSKLYRLILTGSFTLTMKSANYLVHEIFTAAGSPKDEINILDSQHPDLLSSWRRPGEWHSPTTPGSLIRSAGIYNIFPGLRFFMGLIFGRILNKENGYLKAYRSTYTFINFANSKLSGLLLSRLYCGSWTTENIVQDFSYRPRVFSLGWYIQSDKINIFNGTSYATRELVRWLSGRSDRLNRWRTSQEGFKPFTSLLDHLDPSWDPDFLEACKLADQEWRQTTKVNPGSQSSADPGSKSPTTALKAITTISIEKVKESLLDSRLSLIVYSELSRKLMRTDGRLEHWVNQWDRPKPNRDG